MISYLLPGEKVLRYEADEGSPRSKPRLSTPVPRCLLTKYENTGWHCRGIRQPTDSSAVLPKFERRYDDSYHERQMKSRTGIRRLTDTCALLLRQDAVSGFVITPFQTPSLRCTCLVIALLPGACCLLSEQHLSLPNTNEVGYRVIAMPSLIRR